MNQNTFCSNCHRIPSQCCCGSVKELTDEEIADIVVKTDIFDPKWVYLFARAILKRASEK